MDSRADKCAAPASQEEETCPDPGCLWEDDWGVCVPEHMANTPEATERHWGEELSPEAEAYMGKVDRYENDQRLGIGKSIDDWWRRKSYLSGDDEDNDDDNPRYSDGLPPDWLRLVRSGGEWFGAFQHYLADVYTGKGTEDVLEESHDWTNEINSMKSGTNPAACQGVKRLAPYQAVSERLAMTAKLDGARGFLAYHSVGSGKTVTSAVCIDAFLGEESNNNADLFFITTSDNLAQSMEMVQAIPEVSWRERWAPLKPIEDAEERGRRVLAGLGLKFSEGGKTDKKTRASYFAQRYDDFATATNAADIRGRMRRAGRSLHAFGGDSGQTYFAQGDDRRPIIRGGTSRVDENGHYRPLQGCVIMMDEVQNILTPTGKDQTELYNSLREEIMREPDVKVVLLTATPGDTPAQMCAVMNLLVRPPRYLHEGTGLFPSMCSGGGYAAQHATHFLRVEDYLNPLTGRMLDGFAPRLQRDMERKSILVSFAHANENRSVFAEEVCQSRNPATGRCAGHVVEYRGEDHINLPEDTQTHVHVYAPMTAEHRRDVTHTAGGSKRSRVAKELGHDHYTFAGYRLDPQKMQVSWDAAKADGCDAAVATGSSDESRQPQQQQTVRMPICDSKGAGLSENQLFAQSRRLSTIRWHSRPGKQRTYTPPTGLRSLSDVREKVGAKVAALLAVIKQYPNHKHVVICSKFAGDTPKAYKQELAYMLHLVMGALSDGVMGYDYHPLVRAEEQGDRVRWQVCGREACLSRKKYHFALYLTQMPLGMQTKIKKLFNDTKRNVGTANPYMNVLITNRIEGLSLKTTSFVHLLDAPVGTKNYYQAIGRAIRFCSHRDMSDRRVRVYEYFTALPVPEAKRFHDCYAAERAIDDAMTKLRQGYSTEERRGLAFHVQRPTADGVPLDSLDVVTGRLRPRVEDGYHVFSGFVGDLAGINGRKKVARGRVSAPRRSRELRRVADRVFGDTVRQFHAGPQFQRLFEAVGGNMDADAVARNFRMCAGVSGLQNDLAAAEAAYRLGRGSQQSYRALAKRAGLTKKSRVACAHTALNTAHERRVREHMLEGANKTKDEAAAESAVASLLSEPSTFHAPPSEHSDGLVGPLVDPHHLSLLHAAEQASQSAVTPGFQKALADMEASLRSPLRAAGAATCDVFDASSGSGSAGCRTKADCEEGYACRSGSCTERRGIDISTDTVLTEFAGMRFGATREFVLAIMGAAVDCLLMFDFHTAQPGAMYGDLQGCYNP